MVFKLKCRRPLQPNTVPHKQRVQKVLVPYPRRSLFAEEVDGLLDGEAFLFDEVGADEEASAVKAIVAVDAYEGAWIGGGGNWVCYRGRGGWGGGFGAQAVDELDEVADLLDGWRDLGYGREFVVFDPPPIQRLGIVYRTFMADVYDSFDSASPLPHENLRRMRIINLP